MNEVITIKSSSPLFGWDSLENSGLLHSCVLLVEVVVPVEVLIVLLPCVRDEVPPAKTRITNKLKPERGFYDDLNRL